MDLRQTYSEGWSVEGVKNIGKSPWEGQEVTLKKGEETVEIRIMCAKIIQELEDFRNGKRIRLFLSFGMRDIDVYRRRSGLIVIENSPTEIQDYHYALESEAEFDKLIDGFKVCITAA